MEAGRLNWRLQFQAPDEREDGAGNSTDGYLPQFTMSAHVHFLRGGEGVLASRLEQVTPVVLTVRNSTQTKRITGEWRAIDVRAGNDRFGRPRVVYQIKETPRESGDRAWLEMLASTGVTR